MARAMFAAICVGALAAGTAMAAEEPAPSTEKAVSNETELSVVFTEGNSNTQTIGFKNTLVRRWTNESFRLKLEALKSATSDDWFEQVDPGYTWLPGADPPSDGTSSLVKPETEPDAENYFVEARFDKTIEKKLTWHVGSSWDRNEDAGILSRTIVFGGLGNLWRSLDTLKLQTSYGFSWTDREEETPDPEKEERFFGVRLSLNYLQKFHQTTTYGVDWTANMSLADPGDWSSDLTNSVSVAMTKRLSLRVSLRLLYNHEPALEDVDQVARVVVRDPDGIPGSGDEYFETVTEGGYEVVFGETQVRKEPLDMLFTTGLVVSF